MPLGSPQRALAAALFLALGLTAASCRKEKAPFIDTVVQTPHLGMPTDRTSLQSFDLRRLRDFDGVQQVLKAAKADPKFDTLFGLHDHIGIDPINDIDVLVIGSTGLGSPDNPFAKTIFLALGRFPQQQNPLLILDPLREWLGREYLISPPEYTQIASENGGYKIFRTEAKSQYNEALSYQLNFCFPNAQLFLFSFDKDSMSKALDVIAGAAPNMGQDEYWRKLLQKPDVGAMFWGTGEFALPADMKQAFGSAFPKQFYYNFDLSPDCKAEVGLVCASIADATTASAGAKTALQQVKQGLAFFSISAPTFASIPDKINVVPEQETLKFYLHMSESEVQTVFKEITKIEQAPVNPAGGAAPAPTDAPAP